MSESYSESSAYVAGLTLPLDTEVATMVTVKPILTRIADRTKFLFDHGRLIAHQRAVDTDDPTTSHQNIESATFVDITSASVVITPAVGDIMVVVASLSVVRDTSTVGPTQARVTRASTSVSIGTVPGAIAQVSVKDEQKHVALLGVFIATHAEATTFKLQAQDNTSGILAVMNNWSLNVFSLRL